MKNKIDLNKTEELLIKSKIVNSAEYTVDVDFKENLRHELYKSYILSKSNMGFINTLKGIFSNTKYSLIGGLTLTFVTVSVLALTGILNNNANEIKVLKANLSASSGIVEIKKYQTNDWVVASLGETLHQGDSIRTSENSRAVIEIDNGDALRLNDSTEVNLESTLSTNIVIIQEKGETYSRVMKSDKNHYTVKSDEVETLALGTAYSLKLESKKATINTYESKVKVSYKDKSDEVPALKKLIVDLNEVKSELSEVSEEEFKEEFAQWNKQKDEDLGYKYSESQLPIVEITNPTSNISTEDAVINFTGKVSDESDLKKIIVNGTIYNTVDSEGNGFNIHTGEFKIQLALIDGENKISIKAYDIFWNASEEKQVVVTKTGTILVPTATHAVTTTNFSIISISSPAAGKIYLKWTLTGIIAPHGFKVVKSTAVNPVYPGNDYQYLSNESARELTWTGITAGTYHVRVCIYDGNGHCTKYTNDKTVTVSGEMPSNTSITNLTATYNSTYKKVVLNWTVSGTWNHGFKVVWDEVSNPTYPEDPYHYFGDSGKRSDYVTVSGDGLQEGQIYHFRVCLYNGGCASTAYSPDKSVNIPAPTATPAPTNTPIVTPTTI